MKLITCFIVFLLGFHGVAMEVKHDEERDLYLVVGSIREDTAAGTFLGRLIHNGADLDCTHLHTWDGNATTFDLNPSKIEDARHFVGDATTYNFQEYVIRKVYIERMFTRLSNSIGDDPGNLIGAIIVNLKKYMAPGASLEIELDPCISFRSMKYHNLMSEQEIELLRKANPFHGWHHYIITYDALVELANEKFDAEKLRGELLRMPFYNEEMVQSVLSKREQLLAWLDKLAEITSLPAKTLAQRVYQEMTLYHQLLQREGNHGLFFPLASVLPGGTCLDCDAFTDSFNNAEWCDCPRALINNFINMREVREDTQGNLREFQLIDRGQLFTQSFTNTLLGFFAVEQNKEFIVAHLTELGFTDITIEFGKSPYNHRKNSWLVRAVKQADPQ